jgi:HlyD family secretion protein
VPSGNSPQDLLQQSLLQQRLLQYAARLRGYEEDRQRYQQDIRSTEQNLASLQRQLGVVREVEAMRAELFDKQVGSKLNYLDAQAARMHAERDAEDMRTHLSELHHTLEANDASRQVFVDDWHRQQLEDLAKARDAFTQADEALTKARRRSDLIEMTSPADGVVLEIAKRSVGSVLHEAEPLVTLIASDAPLIGDVMISSADIGYTRPNDEAALKIDAFPYLKHGVLEGRLRSIGEESFSQGGGELPEAGQRAGVFHRAQIAITVPNLKDLPPGTHLIPGMSLSAEIKVGTRSVISYFLNPLIRGFHESIREP